MSRKDFELIARTIRFAHMDAASRRLIAIEFADTLRATNARFNRDRFLRACEVVE